MRWVFSRWRNADNDSDGRSFQIAYMGHQRGTGAKPEICFGEGQNRGTGDRSLPAGPGAQPWEDANNHCNNVLTKNP